MSSTALTSIAERAAGYTVIDRRNQISKICWFASATPNTVEYSRDANYIIC
ncbi:MAG TPA: hypothetical protein O0X39_02930 [Methanocorpusculum sp.]|nr:hypothetical protein [Methanocorpusculum sp.]